jgi:hypothetical protein
VADRISVWTGGTPIAVKLTDDPFDRASAPKRQIDKERRASTAQLVRAYRREAVPLTYVDALRILGRLTRFEQQVAQLEAKAKRSAKRQRLTRVRTEVRGLARRLHTAWGLSPTQRERISFRFSERDVALLRAAGAGFGVESPRYTVRYRTKLKLLDEPATVAAWRHWKEQRREGVTIPTPDNVHRIETREVTEHTSTKPPLTKRFRVPGHRSPLFTAVTIKPYTPRNPAQTKESTMGKTRKSTKTKNAKAAEAETDEDEVVLTDDDVEEIENLETDAPDVESDDDEEEDLSELTLKELRKRAKAAGIKGASKKGKEELVAALEEEDEEDDDEDEEDDDDTPDLDGLSRKELKALIKERELDVRVKKSDDDDDIRTKITAALADEDDEDDEEEKPAKSKGKKKGSGKGGTPPPTRELPKGKLGAAEVGKLAGVDGRTARLFLRKHKVAKDEELGRYAFSKKEAEKLAKKLRKEQAESDDD